ncbi:unnamed protein product, partial [Aureobasidium uvarum]
LFPSSLALHPQLNKLLCPRLVPEYVTPNEDIRAAVDEKAQWRHSSLLLLNKTKCLDTLTTLDVLFETSITGLKLVGQELLLQQHNVSIGKVIDTNSVEFLDEGKCNTPSVLLAVSHARKIIKETYRARFNMTEDQTRRLDLFDCATRMLEASEQFCVLQRQCRELIGLVKEEQDLPVGL